MIPREKIPRDEFERLFTAGICIVLALGVAVLTLFFTVIIVMGVTLAYK